MLKKKMLSTDILVELEKRLHESVLKDLPPDKDDMSLAEYFGPEVQYLDCHALPNWVEAQLTKPRSDRYNGLIWIDNSLRNNPFAFTHEIIHYVFDVGYGNKVEKTFDRKEKGRVKSEHEQRIDYITAAYRMPYTSMIKDIERYDNASPRMNPIIFVNELCKKYNADKESVIRRVQEVRKLQMKRERL